MNSSIPVISVESLNYGYTKNQRILKDLNLNVTAQSIYGFLGANGAGKSTTIRSILGLLKPESGSIKLFGKEVRANRLEVLNNVGSLIESPSIYKHLSGYDNLKIACKYLKLPILRIDEILELVNLQQHSKKISKNYSTGMKQRLGLGLALLSDPDLLILDEPTSGLDPTGIIEFRNILQELNAQGKTIFLSSHLLPEIEKIATQVGILKGGQMVFQGTIQELNQLKKGQLKVNIITSNAQQAVELLNGRFQATASGSENIEIILREEEDLPQIIEKMVSNGIKVYEVIHQKDDLEKLFINLTTSENTINTK